MKRKRNIKEQIFKFIIGFLIFFTVISIVYTNRQVTMKVVDFEEII